MAYPAQAGTCVSPEMRTCDMVILQSRKQREDGMHLFAAVSASRIIQNSLLTPRVISVLS